MAATQDATSARRQNGIAGVIAPAPKERVAAVWSFSAQRHDHSLHGAHGDRAMSLRRNGRSQPQLLAAFIALII